MDSMISDQHPENWWRMTQVYSEVKGVVTLLISDPDEIISGTKKER